MMREYHTRPVPTQAIQLTTAIQYEKWGGPQSAKVGDWMLRKDGETYTCDDAVFRSTYRPLGADGWYAKHATVQADIAVGAGTIGTLEGESRFDVGDYVVTNPGGDTYVVTAAKFAKLYVTEEVPEPPDHAEWATLLTRLRDAQAKGEIHANKRIRAEDSLVFEVGTSVLKMQGRAMAPHMEPKAWLELQQYIRPLTDSHDELIEDIVQAAVAHEQRCARQVLFKVSHLLEREPTD